MALRPIPISDIERTLYEKLKKVSDNVYINNAPLATAERKQDYIVLDFGNNIYNEGAYLRTTAIVYVFVRTKLSGVEDSGRLNAIINSLITEFPYTDDHVTVIDPTVSVGVRVNDFTRNAISYRVIIKN